MELGSKVTALEEEIAILKGEIKTILQEVRAAVLARENPFAVVVHETPQSVVPAEPAPAAPEPEAPTETAKVVPLASAGVPPQPEADYFEPSAGLHETDVARPARDLPPARRRWSVGSLATLVAWTQETAGRMDASDMDIVLSLARYGGLIDADLEATLAKLSAPLIAPATTRRQKGVAEYLLALRELAALIQEAEEGHGHQGSGPMRRVS